MDCSRCGRKAVFEDPALCKDHFIEWFEETVRRTISEFSLLDKEERICVAASGGKDSLTVLYFLKKEGYDVTALLIDEGIKGYRDKTKDDLERFCKAHDIPLIIGSFKELSGLALDELLLLEKERGLDTHPCTACGIFRRYLLNKLSEGFDKLVTGHNCDDESQTVMMNLFRANTDLFFRGGPLTSGSGDRFTQRVKPLYFCSEREIMTYSLINGLQTDFTECPYAEGAFRDEVRSLLNEYEVFHKGAKKNILRFYVNLQRLFKEEVVARGGVKNGEGGVVGGALSCPRCGFPSQQGLCKACRRLEHVKSLLSRDQ